MRTASPNKNDLHPYDRDLPSAVSENIDTIAQYYERQEKRLSLPQTMVERICCFFGRPAYLIGIVIFALCWIGANLLARELGYDPVDKPPFHWLKGMFAFHSLVLTVAVLIRQNRMARMADHHAHLDLQVDMLTEQKTSKIITMLEELRRDLPNVQNRTDPEAEELKQPADPTAVLHEIRNKHDKE